MVYGKKAKDYIQTEIKQLIQETEIDLQRFVALMENKTGLKAKTISHVLNNMHLLKEIRIEEGIIRQAR